MPLVWWTPSSSVSASASYRRSQTPSARGTLWSRGPHRSMSPFVSIFSALSASICRVRWYRLGACYSRQRRLRTLVARPGTHAWSMCAQRATRCGFIIARRPEMRKCLYTITRQCRLSEYSVLSHCIAWFIGRSRENSSHTQRAGTATRPPDTVTERRGALGPSRERDEAGTRETGTGRPASRWGARPLRPSPPELRSPEHAGLRRAPTQCPNRLRPSHRGRRHRSRSDLHAAGGGAAPHRRRPGPRGENRHNRARAAGGGARSGVFMASWRFVAGVTRSTDT